VHDESTNRFHVDAWGTTDVGMKRRLNEDVFLVDRESGVFLVADGMGGHAAGEVASRLAAEEIIKIVSSSRFEQGETWPEHWDTIRSAAANVAIDAVKEAHQQVTSAVERDPKLKGMGTTVVVAIHPGQTDKLVICHVGDSRAYRYREGTLTLLTDDHSWVHEQVAAGLLTEQAARSHPLKNVVTQALGGSTDPQADVYETTIEDRDVFLLCSDGLNTMLADDRIAAELERGGTLREMTERLIVGANEQGGNDNITVVLLRAEAVS
jgi:protein phosphatase